MLRANRGSPNSFFGIVLAERQRHVRPRFRPLSAARPEPRLLKANTTFNKDCVTRRNKVKPLMFQFCIFGPNFMS